MKKINLLIIFLLLFTSVNLIADVNIQNVPTFDDFLSGKKIVMKHNFMNNIFALGTIVNFSGLSYEDVVIFGISIRFDGISYKDVYLAGDSIEISGTINGNLRVIARQVNLAHLNVKGNVNITAPEVVIDDTVRCENTTKIWSNDIQMGGWYNELHIKTKKILFSKDVFIDKKLLIQSKEKPAVPINVVEHCDFTYQIPIQGKMHFLLSSKARKLFSFFGLCFPFLLMFFMTPRVLQETIDIIEKNPVWTFLTGLVLLLLTPIALIILMLTIIGAPLGLIFFTFYLSFLYLCRGFTSIATGRIIFRKLKEGKTKMILSLFGGIGIFVLLATIPKVGYVFQFVFMIFGFGGFVVGRIRMFIKLKKENLI